MVMIIRTMVGSIFHRGTNQKNLESVKHFDDDDEDGLAYVGAGLDGTYFGLLWLLRLSFPFVFLQIMR